nr:MAG TPA: hypothetical protein [Caudoviricetes sp.]
MPHEFNTDIALACGRILQAFFFLSAQNQISSPVGN